MSIVMKCEVVNEQLKDRYDDFVFANAHDGGFLQSWAWGRFQESAGMIVNRYWVMDGNDVIASSQLIVKKFPVGFSKLYIPRGPCMRADISHDIQMKALTMLFADIEKSASWQKAIFIDSDPSWLRDAENGSALVSYGFSRIAETVQPVTNFVMNIEPDEKTLLGNMHPKTRYNIGVALRKGISVREGDAEHDAKIFFRLVSKTSDRKLIASHSYEYYEKMIRSLRENKAGMLLMAQSQGEPIAGVIIGFSKRFAVYLHGGFDYAYRQLQAPYLLHWKAIQYAKDRGMIRYDFGGVVKIGNPAQKKWEGITRFKTSFSPKTPLTEYVGLYRKVLMKIPYSLYQLIRGRRF